MKQKKPRILAAILLCLLAVGVLFGVYVGDYYHADTAAEAALLSDDSVTVTQENGSWVFAPDTPTAGLIFYPGGKHSSGAEDAAIVATHLMLAATNAAVDSCRINFFDPEAAAKTLGLPENEEVLMLLDLGHAAEDGKPLPNHSSRKALTETVSYL